MLGLPTRKAMLAVAACVALVMTAFVLAPIVPYTRQVFLSYDRGSSGCTVATSTSGSTDASTCQAKNPVDVTRYATPAYSLLGYGHGPFPSQVLVTQGNHSALIFFNGTRIDAAEDVGPAGSVVNPPESVYIQEAIVQSSDYGQLNVSITVKSYDPLPIQQPIVYLSMAGFSSNYTEGGLTWIVPRVIGTWARTAAPWAIKRRCYTQ